jgi:hypothetical protein
MGSTASIAAISQIGQGTAAGVEGLVQSRALRAQRRSIRRATEAQQSILELQARDAIRRGRQEESQFRQHVQRVIGRQQAAFAAQGVQVDVGSAADLAAQTAALGAVDANTIRNNARRAALGLRLNISGLESQALFAEQAIETRERGTLATGGLAFARGLFGAGLELSAEEDGGPPARRRRLGGGGALGVRRNG